MRIIYVSGTRADYGLMKNTLKAIEEKGFDLYVCATGMHLMKEFGNTYDDIEQDGFKTVKIECDYAKDDKKSMSKFLGCFIEYFTDVCDKMKPDHLLVLGDRAEMLGAASVGAYLGIPVCHVHGGDVSGTVDDLARHAITKLSSIHFAATERSAERIRKMGENPDNVFVVGAPGADLSDKLIPKNELYAKYDLSNDTKLALVVQHPVSEEYSDAARQMENTLEALDRFDLQKIIVYPNADAGGRAIIKVIESREGLKTYESLPRLDFLSLMAYCDVLVGNSSSGIIEAASFKTPVVNIGSRQIGRERSQNIIDVDYDVESIETGIKKALSDEFRKSISNITNVYGDGGAPERIASLLKDITENKILIDKRLIY